MFKQHVCDFWALEWATSPAPSFDSQNTYQAVSGRWVLFWKHSLPVFPSSEMQQEGSSVGAGALKVGLVLRSPHGGALRIWAGHPSFVSFAFPLE